jgi:hypothetical protein
MSTNDFLNDFLIMVNYAAKAPSGHNTQPWKFKIHENSIEIIPNYTKALPAVDGNNRELYISIGCALENLGIMAYHLGYTVYIEKQNDQGIIVNLKKSVNAIDNKLFFQIERRQTNRSVYKNEVISDDAIQQLKKTYLQESNQIYFFQIHSPAANIITEYIMKGNELQMNDIAFKEELMAWMRFNNGEIRKTNDGLTYRVMGFPSIPRLMGKPIVGSFLKPDKQNESDLKKINTSSRLVLFTTQNNTVSEWIDLGRSLQRFLLKAAELGIANAYLNPPCEIESLANELKAKLPINNEYPTLLLRIGYADIVPYSPRKSLEEIME